MPEKEAPKLSKRTVDALFVEGKDTVFWDRDLTHGKFVLIFVAGSQHSIMGQRPVLAPLKRLGAGFGCARAAL